MTEIKGWLKLLMIELSGVVKPATIVDWCRNHGMTAKTLSEIYLHLKTGDCTKEQLVDEILKNKPPKEDHTKTLVREILHTMAKEISTLESHGVRGMQTNNLRVCVSNLKSHL